jgi:hypothetical protein
MFCPHCGGEVTGGQAFCQHCGGRMSPEHPEGTGRVRTAWEDREGRGFLGSLLATLQESVFRPTAFFRSMNVTGGLTEPLLYAMITSMAGFTVSYVWQVLLRVVFHGSVPDWLQSAAGFDPFSGTGLAVLSLLLPFLTIAVLFLWSGVLHALLLMVKGASNGFEATFRAVAYSFGANLFLAVPFCGGLIASLWSMVLVIIGLKEAQGTTGGKATFAVLFPLLFCCAAALLILLVLFGTIAASLGSLSQQHWK